MITDILYIKKQYPRYFDKMKDFFSLSYTLQSLIKQQRRTKRDNVEEDDMTYFAMFKNKEHNVVISFTFFRSLLQIPGGDEYIVDDENVRLSKGIEKIIPINGIERFMLKELSQALLDSISDNINKIVLDNREIKVNPSLSNRIEKTLYKRKVNAAFKNLIRREAIKRIRKHKIILFKRHPEKKTFELINEEVKKINEEMQNNANEKSKVIKEMNVNDWFLYTLYNIQRLAEFQLSFVKKHGMPMGTNYFRFI